MFSKAILVFAFFAALASSASIYDSTRTLELNASPSVTMQRSQIGQKKNATISDSRVVYPAVETNKIKVPMHVK